jgi:hypothetical protein
MLRQLGDLPGERFDLTAGDRVKAACDAVEQRVEEVCAWRRDANYRLEEDSLLAQGADLLTLAKVRLIRCLLMKSPNDTIGPCLKGLETQVTSAVELLHRADQMDYLPLGLLVRAWLYKLQGSDSDCKAVLNRAQAIAQRGPMPLYLADVHLYRARLFGNAKELVAARKLIAKHGYARRNGELADARAALG